MTHDSPFARASLRVFRISTLALAALGCSDSGPVQNPSPFIDARVVAFSSTTGNSTGLSIDLMHADGSSITRLTSSGFLDEVPVWSPDGTSETVVVA